MYNKIFKNKKLNKSKLISYGFRLIGDRFVLSKNLKDCDLTLTVNINKNDRVDVEVTDSLTDEAYILYKIPGAVGEFVGRVRCEIENTLNAICANCFDDNVFKVLTTQKVINHVRNAYGDELEFLWKTDPDCAVFRRKDSQKWYGVIMKVPRSKFGLNSNEICEIMNLHVRNEDVIKLVDNKRIFPAFHMNKKYWISLILEEFDDLDVIYDLIENSFNLAVN